ncbi:MAG: hypothetical protein IJW54_03700 [Clostridia bacterium]|nr:hypothetical protein [Clostridia bacterium]
MKLRYFVIAFIFMANPFLSNIDILPDFIGYLLIMRALSKSTYIFGHAEDAYNSARKMCLISFVKTITILFGSLNDATMSLLLSFSFMIIELIFGIPFVLNMFRFLTKISVDIGQSKVAEESNIIKYFTIVTMIVRLSIAVLPDLTALTMNNGIDTVTIPDLTGFRPIIFLFTGLFSLLFSIVWLVLAILHFKKTITKEFTQKCEEEYLFHAQNNKAFFEGKRTATALFIMLIGLLFLFDVGYSHYVITPDAIAYIFAISCFAYLFKKRYQRPTVSFWILCGSTLGQAIFHVIETAKINEFYSKYTLNHIGAVQEANDLYNMLPVYSVILSVFSVISAVMLLSTLYNYGKNSLEKHKELFLGCDFSYQMQEYKEKMKNNAILVVLFSIVSAITYSLNILLLPIFSGFIFINIFIEILFILLMMKTIFYVHDDVYKRIISFSSLKPIKRNTEA